MKNIIIAISTIIISMSMFSCDSRDKMVQQTEQELKEQMLDPNKYQFIKSSVDTFRVSDKLNLLKSSDSLLSSLYLTRCEQELVSLKIWSGSSSSYGLSRWKNSLDEVKRYRDSASKYIDRNNEKGRMIGEIKGTDKDTIVSYQVHISFYGVNRKGEKRIDDYYKGFKPNKEPMKVVVP
jgi:hypothetical protein